MAAGPFLPTAFGDRDARRHSIARAAGRTVAPSLIAELEAQSAALPASPARQRAIADLARPGSVAVITGQQVGLYLGPLYTVYKAATAIVLARALEAESGVRAVPVFWMATEDHDVAEIDHCTVARRGEEPLRLRVEPAGRVHARQPVANLRLGDDVAAANAALTEALARLPAGAEVASLIASHYQPGRTLGQAFGGVLAALFADEGLIVFDPRRPAVAALSHPAYRTALGDATGLAARLVARNRALADAGLAAQVNVRDDGALVFHHTADGKGAPDGNRDVVRCSEAAALVGEADPSCFSSSALLRPVVQDTLFPTAAYVGGPAEVSYFAQSAVLYERFGLPVPLVAPRARFRIVDAHTRRRLDALGLAPAEVEQPRDALVQRLGRERCRPTVAELRAHILTTPHAELSSLDAPFSALDPELTRALRRTRATVDRAVDRLLARYARAVAGKDAEAVAALDRARAVLYPDDAPQERVFAFASFAAESGVRAFIDGILATIDPFNPIVRDLDR
jgi:bacillithiol biosynthesis cysteine-adding enzyme BshC